MSGIEIILSVLMAAAVLSFCGLVKKACKKIGKGGASKHDDQ